MGSRPTRRRKLGLPILGSLQSAADGSRGVTTVPLDQAAVSTVLQSVADEEVRKQVHSLCIVHCGDKLQQFVPVMLYLVQDHFV